MSAVPVAAPPSEDTHAWDGNDAALDRVRESLRGAQQQIEGALAVLRERGALHMDAAEAFARARTLCHRAERRLRGACGALSTTDAGDGDGDGSNGGA